VPAIPALTAGGSWTRLIRREKGNADGIVADKDGNIVSAAEDDGTIEKIDPLGNVTVLVPDAHAGSLSLDRQGRLFGVTHGGRAGSVGPAAAGAKDAAVQYTPQRRTIETFADGSKLGYRPSDLVADNRGGAFVSMMGPCLFYAGTDGFLHLIENTPRIAGVAVSPDERILYAAFNGSDGAAGSIVAYDITGPGVVSNRRTLATLPAGNGNSLLVDAAGRIYTPNARSIQVYDKTGKHLGTLPTPDTAIAVALGGPDRKTLVVVTEDTNPPPAEGGRQVSRSFWTMPMLTTGFKDRGK
jgi:sugar lactone lactonase YvrE